MTCGNVMSLPNTVYVAFLVSVKGFKNTNAKISKGEFCFFGFLCVCFVACDQISHFLIFLSLLSGGMKKYSNLLVTS